MEIQYFGYFCSFDASQANTIKIESLDRSKKYLVGNKYDKEIRISLGSIISLKKFQVDPLGYINEVKQEKRQGIIEKKCKKQKN